MLNVFVYIVVSGLIDIKYFVLTFFAAKFNGFLEYENDSGETIMLTKTDQKRMQQIFLNLLSNALKFTPKNGMIKVLIQEI